MLARERAAPGVDRDGECRIRLLNYVLSHLHKGNGSFVPALRVEPAVSDVWEPCILSRTYDPRLVPVTEKGSAILGMGMTEKQGGSDVRAPSMPMVDALAATLSGNPQITRVEIGGHVGSMAGHCGRFVFEGNAPAVVAAKLLETTGFGGRIAYGFGRVAVTVEGPL